jgi:hypothetical protein
VVHEPVDEWRAVRTDAGGPPVNLLEAFYADPKRYAYTFQHYVLLTRMAKVRLVWDGMGGGAGREARGHGGGARARAGAPASAVAMQ